MQREADGYFTVEAAMILPIVLFTILWIIYLWFFQYNRCLMEQNVGVLALRGAVLEAEDNEDRIEQLRKLTDAVYHENYIAWECGVIELKLEKGIISVEQRGQISYGNKIAETTAVYENHIVSPVSFIRNCQKIIGGQ